MPPRFYKVYLIISTPRTPLSGTSRLTFVLYPIFFKKQTGCPSFRNVLQKIYDKFGQSYDLLHFSLFFVRLS